MRRDWVAGMVALLVSATAAAQSPPALRGGMIELSGFAHRVTNDFGNWRGGRIRAVVPSGATVVYLEAVAQSAFRDDGQYGSAALQHGFGEAWIGFVAVGGGTGEFFWPELRVDASLARKLLPSRRLVMTVGGTWVRSKEVYRDRAATASVAAYLGSTAVLEVGGRFNWSTPGDVTSQRGHLALTLGRPGQRYLVLRGAAGSEAYQLTGSGATEQQFNSTEASVSWREWLGRRFGIVVGGEWYDNPFYTRTGVQLGLFAGW